MRKVQNLAHLYKDPFDPWYYIAVLFNESSKLHTVSAIINGAILHYIIAADPSVAISVRESDVLKAAWRKLKSETGSSIERFKQIGQKGPD